MTAPYNSPAAPGSNPEIEAIKKSALTWTIIGFLCGTVIAGVLGLLGYLKADTEPETAKNFTKWAKIVTMIMLVLWALIIILYIVLIVVGVGLGAATSGTESMYLGGMLGAL